MGEPTKDVIALAKPDVLMQLLQKALDAGGDTTLPETRGDAINELATAYAVVLAAPEARRVLGLVLSGKPLSFVGGRFHEVKHG